MFAPGPRRALNRAVGLSLILAALAIFLAATAGVLLSTLAGLGFAARALARRGDRAGRVRAGVRAGLCAAGLIASAGAGFVGISALLYYTTAP